VLSIIIELRVSSSKLQEVLDELKKCDIKIDTVFNVGLIGKVSDDGPRGNDEQARRP